MAEVGPSVDEMEYGYDSAKLGDYLDNTIKAKVFTEMQQVLQTGFNDINTIHVLQPSLKAYDDYLSAKDSDYVGIRLHGGVYAMRHKRRAIIIAIDERARAINEMNHLNCIEKDNLEDLEGMINSNLPTEVCMDYEAINKWKSQFREYDV